MSEEIKTFPLRLKLCLSEEIDNAVFLTRAKSKHQYIIEAVREKLEKDLEGLRNGKSLQR